MQGAAALHREIIPPPGRSVKLLDRTMAAPRALLAVELRRSLSCRCTKARNQSPFCARRGYSDARLASREIGHKIGVALVHALETGIKKNDCLEGF